MRRKSTYAKMIHVVQFSEQKNWKIEINSLKNGLQNVKLESQNLGKGILFLASQNGAKKDHIANVITYDEYQFINYCFRSFMCALNTIEILFHMLLCNKMRKKNVFSYVLASYIAMNHGIVIPLLFMNEYAKCVCIHMNTYPIYTTKIHSANRANRASLILCAFKIYN